MNKEEIENIIRRVRVAMYNHAKGFFDYDDVVDYGLNYNEWKQLLDYIEKLTQENNDLEERVIHQDNLIKQLKEQINTYENPDDLTLIFMYCEEKAKDKIKELQSVIDKAINQIEITIETINQQPSKNIKDDEYLIVRLKSFINILRSKNE